MDKQQENELQRLREENKKLREECNQYYDEVQRINQRLEEAENFKSHFIAKITNELINPFTSIMGLSKTILASKKEEWKKVISLLSLVHSEAFELDFQLRNMLWAARIEAGELEPKNSKIDLTSFCDNIKESIGHYISRKKLHFNMQYEFENEDSHFTTDPEKLQIILYNLIKNAINHSPENQTVKTEIKTQSNNLVIIVSDKGIGIAEEQKQFIFDRFKQVDDTINSIYRGQGLGLAVTKALSDFMEATIEINSKPNAGTEFTVTIPESSGNIPGFAVNGNEMFFDEEF